MCWLHYADNPSYMLPKDVWDYYNNLPWLGDDKVWVYTGMKGAKIEPEPSEEELTAFIQESLQLATGASLDRRIENTY